MSHRARFLAITIAVCTALQQRVARAQSPIALQSFTISPTGVTGGTSITGTVTLTRADVLNSVRVDLVSNNAAAQVNPSVSVPKGQTTATFTIRTSGVGSLRNVQIKATRGVEMAREISIAAPTLSAFSVTPGEVIGGREDATGNITISGPAGASGFPVTASSRTITVPPGQTSTTYTISTVWVAETKTVTITASQGAISKPASLIVQHDPVLPNLSPVGGIPPNLRKINTGQSTMISAGYCTGVGNNESRVVNVRVFMWGQALDDHGPIERAFTLALMSGDRVVASQTRSRMQPGDRETFNNWPGRPNQVTVVNVTGPPLIEQYQNVAGCYLPNGNTVVLDPQPLTIRVDMGSQIAESSETDNDRTFP